MVMLFKENLETPDNYLKDVKNSRTYVEEKLVPPLKRAFESSASFEGQKNRDNNRLSYALRFDNNEDLSSSVKKIKTIGWVQYKKEFEEDEVYSFCKDKYGLEVEKNRGYTFATIKYSKSSPCWDFKETLKDDLYQLVE